jgi:hypothetical protein
MYGKELKVWFCKGNKKEKFGLEILLRRKIRAMLKHRKYSQIGKRSIEIYLKKKMKNEMD